MAIPRRIRLSHQVVFPHGGFAVAPAAPVRDYDRSTKDVAVQKVDEESGLLMWQLDVLDADPEASRSQRTVSIKILAAKQPVLPSAPDGMPVVPVQLENLEGTPYVDTNGSRPRLAWSFRATGITSPNKVA